MFMFFCKNIFSKHMKIPRWTRGPGPPRDRQIQDFWFWTDFQEIKKIPFQGDHSKFEFLECCLKKADDPPGRGASPPLLGDPCILSQPRNSNFEWSPWKGICLILWKCVQNQKSCMFVGMDVYGNIRFIFVWKKVPLGKSWKNYFSGIPWRLGPSRPCLCDRAQKKLQKMVSKPLYDHIRPWLCPKYVSDQ